MTSPESTSEVSVLSDQQEGSDKKAISGDQNVPKNAGITRSGRRSAFAAFGDDVCDSPARKKQNTATSLPAIENRSSITNTSVEKEHQNALNNDPGYLDVDTLNRPVDDQIIPASLSIENDDVKTFDLVPSTRISPAKTIAATTISNIRGTEKMIGVEKMVLGPQNVKYDNLKSANPDDAATYSCPSKSIHSRKYRIRYRNGGLWWIGILFFANTFVLAGMILSGLLLNERTIYQLRSIECMNRLHLAYQAMDLISEFEFVDGPNDENSISDCFEEHEFYWKELEAQVRYWKKEAKKVPTVWRRF